MKILFKTVCYQGRGRDRFQHSSVVLPGNGGAGGLCREPPAIPGKSLERECRALGNPPNSPMRVKQGITLSVQAGKEKS